jgi:N-acetylglucosamine kinase-like BadF-type ATPase
LLDAAVGAFGSVEALSTRLQGSSDRVRRIAAFAPAVVALAEDGDPVAGLILERGAEELAMSAYTALRRSGNEPDGEIALSWAGALLSHATHYRDALDGALRRRLPAASLVPPRGHPLDGVVALSDLPCSHPLSALAAVSAATD